ncbi:MAG: hypothetical protein EOM73_10640, partial [Bacteroidia bacterium]|nr:hypothetical protein [Bacteroidia bacterium]
MSIISILPDWTQVGLLEQVFWVVTIPATVVFLILLALTIFGGDADTGVDVDSDVDSGLADGDSIPFQFISLKNIVAFFAVFGWSGIGFVKAGMAPWMVILLAVV